jgi:hypothetical protein
MFLNRRGSEKIRWSRRLPALALALFVLLPFHVAAARATTERAVTPSIKLRARGRRIVLTAGGRTQTLALGDKISSARLDSVKLIFVTRRAGFVYLLADARGQSKLRPDMHECGAGEEFDLVWLKLNARWRLVEARSARYESCWGSVTSDDGYKIEKRVLRVAYSDFKWKRESRLTYDADQPEHGFTLEESEMKDP